MHKLFLLFLLTPLLFANVISGIAVIVDDETITLYEITQEQTISKASVKKTVDSLIRTKLEAAEAKKRNISVTNREVLDELKKMAKQNNMTLSQLYEAMNSARNLSESQTKDKIRENILKRKLFNAIAMSQIDEPTDEEVTEYYNLHIDDYKMPKYIDAVVYSAKDKKALEQKISNPMMNLPQVSTETTKLELSKMNPRLAQLLIETKDYNFTPIIPQGGTNGYMTFYVQEKLEVNTPPLALIRPQVQKKISDSKREHILNDHFQRARIKANIKIIRLPKE